jgi:hypothetical protein
VAEQTRKEDCDGEMLKRGEATGKLLSYSWEERVGGGGIACGRRSPLRLDAMACSNDGSRGAVTSGVAARPKWVTRVADRHPGRCGERECGLMGMAARWARPNANLIQIFSLLGATL